MAVIVVIDIVVMVWGVEESLHDDVEALAAGGVAGVAVAAEALTAAAHARHTQHGLHPKQRTGYISLFNIRINSICQLFPHSVPPFSGLSFRHISSKCSRI